MPGDVDGPLAIGTRIRAQRAGAGGIVLALIGLGGQGAVYKVDYEGSTLALKWYHDSYHDSDPGLRDRLTKAIHRGAPDIKFLWPLEMVHVDGKASFGYLMPLRNASYQGMIRLIAAPEERIVLPLGKRLALCLNIARSFFNLHARGFCYQDINFGNFFFNEHTADVFICDNDNVNVDGAPSSIYGTRKFMAPEVVRRESLPNTRTDLFSMAVMFHYVLMGWHPLEGAREYQVNLLTAAEELRLYGSEPLFMFDRNDSSNGPVLPYHSAIATRWRSLAEACRQLFNRSFERGLSDPYQRVVESEWIALFESMEQSVLQCPQCQHEQCFEYDAGSAGSAYRCAHCNAPIKRPAVLKIGRRTCIIEPERVIPKSVAFDEALAWESIGIVERHPTDADVLGIRNLSESDWQVVPAGGSQLSVKPGDRVRVIHGLKIDFGTVSGYVCC